jgi:GT2 family glycosyltransferase
VTEQLIAGLTDSFMPASAFAHLDPTAVGVLDLDGSLVPRAPGGDAITASRRDAILLVRLHEQPLGVIHVVNRGDGFGERSLARLAWEGVGDQILEHVDRCRCSTRPSGPDDLLGGIGPIAITCGDTPSSSPEGTVSVIVCTAGRADQLEGCIDSLLAQRDVDFELLVVDNRPADDDVRNLLKSHFANDDRVRYVAEWRAGLSVARNRGVAETAADFVAFTDDDVCVDPDWLRWLVAPFADPDVGGTSGLVLPLELETAAQKRFERYAGFSKGFKRRIYDRDGGLGPERLLYPFMGDVFGGGASMAFRRPDLLANAGFDPALSAGTPTCGGEDMYAFSQMILRGRRTVYEPRSVAWHQHRKDETGLRKQVFGWGVGLGAVVTKASLGDPRFYAAAARSLPVGAQMLRRRTTPALDGDSSRGRPEDLLRLQRRGIVQGPYRYGQSVRRSRRLRLDRVIHGG